ncbi:hypothetical protein IPM62_03345 [Candidatus Woesebacteria bacterium]|nr:MAG: hypothetical protein IPM62_03345 [Candidatus Woesebacteria bacterium]
MTSYFSTFTTGFSEVVSQALLENIKDIHIDLLTDGLVIYKTATRPNEIKNLKYFNNSFLLLKHYHNVDERFLYKISKSMLSDDNIFSDLKNHFPHRTRRFRIRAAIKNQHVSLDKNIVKKLEHKITSLQSNFVVDRSLVDLEILITIRSEGFALVGVQFTGRPNYEKTLSKGELYPELAYILCLISEPKKDDIFLDPFAGHGSITAQRLFFPHKEIHAGEIDNDLLTKLRKKFNVKVIVDSVDALSLKAFDDSSINKIVTDPPWGLFDTNKDIPNFYALMLKQFHRVLKADGIIVVLTAQKELIENLLEKYPSRLILENKYTTLVSGKKAGVYKIRKIS